MRDPTTRTDRPARAGAHGRGAPPGRARGDGATDRPPGGAGRAAPNGRARGLAILAPLDELQRAAALATRGPGLVLAGPGTGKSRVLAHHLAYLCAAEGVPSRRVLALARDDAAAERLRRRAERLLGGAVHGAWIGTALEVGQRILRAHAAAIGRRPSFRVLGEEEAQILARRAAREAGAALEDGRAPARLREAIVLARGRGGPGEAAEALEGPAAAIGAAYRRILAEENAIDPEELLGMTLGLLDENPGLAERYRRRFEHVLVDGLEDASPLELALIRRLAAPAGDVLATGDDDVSVRALDLAGWRAIESFLADFAGARVLPLRQGYRCSRRILYVADRLIRRNRGRLPKEPVLAGRQGARVIGVTLGDEEEEASAVVRWIRRLVARGEARPGRIAIVHRQLVQARPFEEALVRAGLPYQVAPGQRFWARREIRDVMSYLRLAFGGGDPVALARVANVPRRGIGPASVVTIARLQRTYRVAMAEAALRAAQLPRVTAQRAGALADLGRMLADLEDAARRTGAADLIDYLVERTGYGRMLGELSFEEEETRREGIDELKGLARSFAGAAADALPRLFDRVAAAGATPWAAGVPSEEEARDGGEEGGVQVLTYRAAKDRDLDVVFLTGLEEGTLPHARAVREGEDGIEGERRLLYLGLTRARRRVILTRALARTVSGEVRAGGPSRFLAELGRRVRHYRLGSARPGATPRATAVAPAGEPEPSALAVVRVGQRVAHPRYGAGVVTQLHAGADAGGQDAVTVQFDEGGEKRLVLALARLRPG